MFLGERMRHDEREKYVMNCEEFEAIGLDIERDSTGSAAEQAAAREHASTCSRCAALQDSWIAAKLELSALGEATRAAQTPKRVEMRLRQEFRTRHRSVPARRAAVIAAWALATAAVLVGAVSWRNWQRTHDEDAVRHEMAVPSTATEVAIGSGQVGSGVERASSAASGQNHAQDNLSATLTSADDGGEFTLLPGSVPADTEDAAIWRVQMQRAALSALGFPVNEDRAGEWIQVDLLVGNDGLPQGVRLAR
ncbi:MAG TPA: hypothetical protein VHF01_05095 [Candidatus Acidoferrum sp.]|nr:hypothetical protein [Candidatus Acidoferrum sp.]